VLSSRLQAFIIGGVFLFSLVSCKLFAAEVVPLGASPMKPSGIGRQTEGWHDIYLTHRRICRDCKMIDLGNEQVELLNRKGVRGQYLSTEVLGVDYHPFERKFAWHVLRNINPIAGNTLMPAAYNQKRKDVIDGTGD
jgi:hypothetical protein